MPTELLLRDFPLGARNVHCLLHHHTNVNFVQVTFSGRRDGECTANRAVTVSHTYPLIAPVVMPETI